MSFCQFIFFRCPSSDRLILAEEERPVLGEVLRATPNLTKALIHTPTSASVGGPFAGDEAPPPLALQLYFDELTQLEAQIARGAHLQALGGCLPSLKGAEICHQVMLVRTFPTPAAPGWTADDPPRCTYLVHYPGHAEDMNAWLGHYVTHHPQLMYYLPGIREIEVYSRVDWCDALPWVREDRMQRNKVVFDNPAALSEALRSPELDAMRADYFSFPTFHGANVHYPMLTRAIEPTRPR